MENKYGVVVDFKRLNITIPDSYLITDINNTFAILGECKSFTTLELTSGFYQMRMKERDIENTVFSLPLVNTNLLGCRSALKINENHLGFLSETYRASFSGNNIS